MTQEEIRKAVEKAMGGPVHFGNLDIDKWLIEDRPLLLKEIYKDDDVVAYYDEGFGYLILVEKINGNLEVSNTMGGALIGKNYYLGWCPDGLEFGKKLVLNKSS